LLQNITERIAQLRARLTPEGRLFFDEYRQKSDDVSAAMMRGENTETTLEYPADKRRARVNQ
jgi:hypothetical protein